MILIDTSVWIDHFNKAEPMMLAAAERGVVMHPYVVVELALGSLHDRGRTLADLNRLPSVLPMRQPELNAMLERDGLYGTRLNFVDLHLVGSARTIEGCLLWTRDKRMRAAAERFGVAANLP